MSATLASCALDDRILSIGPRPFGAVGAGAADAGSGTARLELAPGAVDFGRVSMGFQARERLQLRNAGNAAMGVPAVSWSTQDADFELLQNQCLSVLAPGQSCELRVSMLPSRAMPLGAALRIDAQEGGSFEVPLRGEGLVAGNLILAPAPGSFDDLGSIQIGSSGTGVFTVTNSGSQPTGPLALHVSRPEFALQAPDATTGQCQPGVTSLAPGQACDVRVVFAPAARGPLEATLTVETPDAGSISTRLLGDGLAPGALVAGTAALDFKGVVLGEGAVRAVGFSNEGDQSLTLLGARLEPAMAEGFSIKNSDCGAGRVLDVSARCSVLLEFRPAAVAQELSADLVADVAGASASLRVPLRGVGLESGRLELTTDGDGVADFGAVLLEGSQTRTFRVLNPSPQPSGVLGIDVTEGFSLAPPAATDACVPGSTSLAQGQSCTLDVNFAPTARARYYGSLTVVSALAGSKSSALSAQGIVPARLHVDAELDFGRVFTNAPALRTLTVSNQGDQPLPPPMLELSSPSGVPPAAFSFSSACDRELNAGEECRIDVNFAPTEALPQAANLTISAEPGGGLPVLLLGEGLVPGSLVLVAAEGTTPEFGDVAIGALLARSFTLTNPGSVPSGPLVFRTDDEHFVISEGDCNQGDPAGLVDGSSCTFSVQFSPNDSAELTSNLVVQSTGAGLVGVELTGRGRRPATLEATGNRDLGRANIGQPTLTSPENEFVWTLNNTGDLPSGALAVVNDNMAEFVVSNDLCNGAVVPGLGSCTLTVRFVPSAVGARTATITVSDPSSNPGSDPSSDPGSDPSSDQSALLALTGVGVQLAALGESCVNAECAQGTCSAGVCCDKPCDGTCQACVAGVCTDQSNREPCGDGNARCFGVDRCLLPEGLACGQGADCGSGNCERRLGGAGAADSICCVGDCDATGLQCNASGACEQPTAGDGTTCGRPGDLPCAGGLECKACGDGASRCTPAAECCDVCQAPLVCIDGQRCDCPPQPNGGASISCGGGLCIPSRLNACCPATPDCDSSVPNCDPADNLCKQCVVDAHCQGQGPNRACSGGVCGCAANAKSCPDGSCVLQTACCGECGGGQSCVGGECRCPADQDNVGGTCRLRTGAVCSQFGAQCGTAAPNCVAAQDGASRCCTGNCPGNCTTGGQCLAPASLVSASMPINFGTVEVGATPTAMWTIRNDGQLPATVNGGNATPPVAVDTSSCGTIQGGSSCTVTVSLVAQTPGAVNSQASVSTSAGTVSIAVSATIAAAQRPALLTGDPASLDFGSVQVGQSKTLVWTINNVGDVATGERDLDSTGAPEFRAAMPACPPIAGGSRCTMNIVFTPSAALRFDAQFSTESLAPQGGRIGLTATGVGTEPPPPVVAAAPNLNISPRSFDFGSIDGGDSVATQFTIGNDGGASGPLAISMEETTPRSTFSVAPTSCPSLDTTGTCVVTVTYTPALTSGEVVDDLATLFVRDSNGTSLGTAFVTGATSGFIDVPSFF